MCLKSTSGFVFRDWRTQGVIGHHFWLHGNTRVTIMSKDPSAPSCLEPEWPWPDQARKCSARYVFEFCVGISRQCPPLAFAPLFPSRPTDALAEEEGGIFDLTVILVIQTDSCFVVSAPIGSSSALLGRQEMDETGAWPAGLGGKLTTPPSLTLQVSACFRHPLLLASPSGSCSACPS